MQTQKKIYTYVPLSTCWITACCSAPDGDTTDAASLPCAPWKSTIRDAGTFTCTQPSMQHYKQSAKTNTIQLGLWSYETTDSSYKQAFTCKSWCDRLSVSTVTFLASPVVGDTNTRKGESGMCWSLNLTDTWYSPGSVQV